MGTEVSANVGNQFSLPDRRRGPVISRHRDRRISLLGAGRVFSAAEAVDVCF